MNLGDFIVEGLTLVIAFLVGLFIVSVFDTFDAPWWVVAVTFGVVYAIYFGATLLAAILNLHVFDRFLSMHRTPERDHKELVARRYASAAGLALAFLITRFVPVSDIPGFS